MLTNYIKIAYRFLKKHKLITGINILSLSIGISATLVIFVMVHYEYSFDKQVPDKQQVYRVVNNGKFKNSGVFVPMARTMAAETPNIDVVAPIFMCYIQKLIIDPYGSNKERVFSKEENIVLTNSQYFKIFPLATLAGDLQGLDQPGTIVLSQASLFRYFGNVDPLEVIGKTITFADSIPLQIRAVVDNIQGPSDFKFDSYISELTISSNENLKSYFNWDAWNSISDAHQLLIKTKAGTDPSHIEANIKNMLHKYKGQNGAKITDHFILQPLAKVHFDGTFNYKATKPATQRNLMLLAFFLLALGAVNFINLSTAQATERAKEVGIRKTLGSSKSALVKQFLLETLLVTSCATLLSLISLPLFIKVFEGFIPENLTMQTIPSPQVITFLILQLLGVTFLAGIYPAWILTGYAPALALKNQHSNNSNLSRSAWIRRGLTVFQFVLAQTFLIAVLVVSSQIRYMSSKDMGFKKDAILNIYIPGSFQNSEKGILLRNELKRLPEVKLVSFGNIAPAMNGFMTNTLNLDLGEESQELTFDSRTGDENYIDLYKIPLIKGRNIHLLDSTNEVLVNEKALEFMRIKNPEDALGRTFNNGQLTIVGVIKDFDISSARQHIRPLIYIGKKDGYVLHIAMANEDPATWTKAMEKIGLSFKAVFPNDEMDIRFVDKEIEKMYTKDLQLSKLLSWAVALSILIAGLGLFGLAVFTATQRTKEIGVRKVLGASVLQIVFLLLKNLILLVGIACLIDFPIAYYSMHHWLQEFVYRTTISPWIFAVSALGLITFAALILAIKSIYAARANPVDSLRSE